MRTTTAAWVVALTATVVAAVPGGAHAGGAEGVRGGGYSAADLREDLAAVRAAGGGDVNVVARVDRAGQQPLRARYGTAGLGSTAPVPWNPEFRVASTSKTFLAVVVLQLAAEHRLSLDDTVEHWLPGVVTGQGNDGSRITVRDLLQQTSGIYDYVDDPAIQDSMIDHFAENRFDDTSAEQLVALAMGHPPLFAPGGDRWAYSNTNYLLAAMIAQKASGGQSWQELEEHRVIAPLGLRDTYIPGANPYLVGPHTRVTITGPDGTPLDLTDQSFQHTADSDVVSTPADLDTFFRALASGTLLPPTQLAEMRTTVPYDDLPVPPAGTQGGYGLGLRVIPLTCGGTYNTHEGDGLGAYARPAVSADGRRAVTLSITTTTALIDQDKVDRAVETLTDHALCDTPTSQLQPTDR
jgi:D-alanyl-D-alanine carboxypeptidase